MRGGVGGAHTREKNLLTAACRRIYDAGSGARAADLSAKSGMIFMPTMEAKEDEYMYVHIYSCE
jgi:hypothetical protein